MGPEPRSAGLTVREYRDLVEAYKGARDKDAKRALESRIGGVKQRFQAEALDKLSRSINAEIATLRAREAQLGLFDGGGATKSDNVNWKRRGLRSLA